LSTTYWRFFSRTLAHWECGEMAMTSLSTKVFAASLVCLAGAGLLGPTEAHAAVFQVDLTGDITPRDGSTVPFSGSFDVDTSVQPVQHLLVGGLDLTGYPDAAISHVSITVLGVSFSAADIDDLIPVAGEPGSAVFFSEDLHPGASPSIAMQFSNEFAGLMIGGTNCGETACSFVNDLFFSGPGLPDSSGTVAASVVSAVPTVPEPSTWAMLLLGFAGLGLTSYRHTRKNRVASAAN
jgi:PEP-CTERM motif-containing protein